MDDWRMNGELFLADPDRGRTAADFGIVPQLCYNRRRRDDEKVTKSETIRARVEPTLKRDAEAVLSKLGLTPTEAITLFYKQVALYRGLPFPVRIPNAATRRALREAQDRKNIESFESVAKEMGSV